MPVDAIGQTTPSPTLAAAAANTGSIGADFNMFLRLLTTQMQNQDPLDPMKTNEYTQQLAQYSQIEQTVQQGTTLKEILARLSTQDIAQASGMIGRDAVFASAAAGLGAAPASWTFTPARTVNALVATITDANAKIVDTRTLDPAGTKGQFSWDGQLANGTAAPQGLYTLKLAATDAAGKSIPVTINSIGKVSAVNQVGGTLSLIVNGTSLPIAALQSLAAAGT